MNKLYIGLICKLKKAVDMRFYGVPQELKPEKKTSQN